MAIPAACVWEVRTTGDATNGGGFNSDRGGTDYSQQDTAQLSLTDLACASNTTLTSATGGFTAAMVGNVIYIASGTNAAVGYYEITAYTDTNTVTIDRTSADGGNMTAGVGKVGGASTTTAIGFVGGNTIWIASGTYNETLTANVWDVNWRGYKSGTARTASTGDDRPLFDGQGTRTYGVNISAGRNRFYNIRVANATSHGFYFNSTGTVGVFNCKSSSNGGNGFSRGNGNNIIVTSESNNNDGNGFASVGTVHCYSHDNTGAGFVGDFAPDKSIADSNSSHGLQVYTGVYSIEGLVFYNNLNGVYISGQGNTTVSITNCIFHSNGRGINIDTRVLSIVNNSFYNNTTEDIKSSNTVFLEENNLTSDPKLNNPASGDFTLQSGSPLIGAGLDVSTFTSSTTPFNVNIGVDQTNPDGGGGGTTVSNWFAGE